ncbi:WSSV366 [White spot syndrome virus]|uniref:WSSV366 n=1 Tax=White spot syndrome virus TaxID=342409 RepID=A0A2I6SC54_9VIRU|nr:WSSV366 [White spot syndrome virus]
MYEKTLQPIEEEDIGYKDYVVSIEDDDNVDDGDQQEQMIMKNLIKLLEKNQPLN